MSSTREDIAKVSSFIRNDFGLESTELVHCDVIQELKSQLSKIISYLIDNDFQRLLNAMYRIDINEEKFKKALATNPPTAVSEAIAQLIIEREMQKVQLRKKYS